MKWQEAIQTAVRSPQILSELLEIDPVLFSETFDMAPDFPLEVPLPFVARMKKRDLDDPLLRQVLPLNRQSRTLLNFEIDPLQEQDPTYNAVPGLLHKYPGRVLVLSTGRCAVNCQYCFRQNFPYSEQALGKAEWGRILTYISEHSEVHEVIFSGGDPLTRSDANWAQWLDDLEQIPQVKMVRFHTRFPVVIPNRLTTEFLRILKQRSFKSVLVLHSNHPQEWDSDLIQAVRRFTQEGILVLNQGVLLKGVNDEAAILIKLSHRVWEAGVLPYYWHRLDPILGAEHFEIPLERIKALEKMMMEALPGYLVPRFVVEVPGALSKQPI